MKRNQKGFTLIELLIVVAIIGIIVAIAIPNLLNAIQRAKQKRTMGDMRSAGTAAEAYAVDFNHYPAAAGYTLPTGVTFAAATFGAATAPSSFNGQVTPTYIRVLPLSDGWQSYFFYVARPARTTSSSPPARTERQDGSVIGGATTDFNDDIIFVERSVRSVPRGRAAVSPPASASKSPLTGALSFCAPFRAPRIPAVKRGLATGRTALLGGALGLAFAAALLGPGALAGLVPARGDLADFFWPMKAYTAARWAAGSLPLWNPLSGCGEPWLAQLQTGVLYPGDLPFLLGGAAGPLARDRPAPRVAAAGMAAWLSDLGTSRAGALAGAAVFAGGGAFLSLAPVYNNFCTAAFLPWLFLGARRAVRGASPAPFALAVGARLPRAASPLSRRREPPPRRSSRS